MGFVQDMFDTFFGYPGLDGSGVVELNRDSVPWQVREQFTPEVNDLWVIEPER